MRWVRLAQIGAFAPGCLVRGGDQRDGFMFPDSGSVAGGGPCDAAAVNVAEAGRVWQCAPRTSEAM
jgi:hypothetical protein